MTPEWWTIIVSAWPQGGTASGVVIRLIQSSPGGERALAVDSVSDATDQIADWLTELIESQRLS